MSNNFNPFNLYNKNVIITGASSGIGRQCAVLCSKMGARVVLTGRNKERLKETLELMGSDAVHQIMPMELTDFNNVETEIIKIIEKTGKIHGLVNCAGISTTTPVKYVTPEKMEEFFRVNVYSAFNLARIMVRQNNMADEGGSIIFISSVMGITGEYGKSLYSSTKGSLISLSKSMAIELASRKIRINCISPGVVDTPMSQAAIYSRDANSLNRIRELHPLGIGNPEDVAYAAIFLLSDASKWITGTNLIVDGGYTAR